MSLRNRARRLQQAAGLTYQQALARLRALGAAPADLARRWRWPLARCDRFLVDRALDDEWREVAAGAAPEERACEFCGRCFFALPGDGQDGCADCRRLHPRQAIDVIDATPVSRADLLRDVCETLLATACARSVVLLDRRGRALATVGEDPAHARAGWLMVGIKLAPHRRLSDFVDGAESIATDLGDGRALFAAPVARRALLAVLFDQGTSLGLVRLRARRAIADLERLLADAPAPFGGSGGAAPGGRGGPAEAGLDVRALRRRRS